MNQSFFTAAVGAGQQQQRLNVHANNIANVNTHCFKAGKPTFASLMYSGLQGIDGQNLPKGSGSQMILADPNFNSGGLQPTEQRLDYAIIGEGFFALYNPADGEISYTRDGSFTLSGFERPNQEGILEYVHMLSDGEGRFVMGQNGEPLEVTNPDMAQPIAVYTFENTNGMSPLGGGRFSPLDKNGPAQLLANPNLQQGFLESSNTDLAQELGKVIESQRSYSYALKMVQTSDEIESTINGLRG
jgi:flagellar basal-body rod protein FlgG